MNKRIITLMAAALALLSATGQVSFTHVGQYRPIEVTTDIITSVGKNMKVYVVYDTDGVGMTFQSTTGEPAVWYSYDMRGGAYPEVIPGVKWNGIETTLDQVIPNRGYIIEEGTDRTYLWVVNYADYYMTLNGISIVNDTPCSLLSFSIDGTAPKITYTYNGQIEILDRQIKLSYNTLDREEKGDWFQKPVVETFESLDDPIRIDQPLCNTVFTLSGDRFLEEWGLQGKPKESDIFETQAVNCGSKAVQDGQDEGDDDDDDDGSSQDGELGGSAPAHIVFTGYPTDGVVYRIWEMALDENFENVILQYNQDEVDYTFIESGTFYMRYKVANADGSCEAYGDTYRINVSESELGGSDGRLPNVFSPTVKDEINDVWKVSHKSLLEFHCWIFNRWGTLVYEFTDPDGGWDGTYNGRLVDPGVYYYVITATGSDGKKYKKRGDINILHYKKGASSGGGTIP